MADAAYIILSANSREFTGNFCVDEQVLRTAGADRPGALPLRRRDARRICCRISSFERLRLLSGKRPRLHNPVLIGIKSAAGSGAPGGFR